MVFSKKLVDRYVELKQRGAGLPAADAGRRVHEGADDDARTVSAVTGLKLQMSGSVDAPVVLGGFPKSGLDAYVGKLVRAGHSVAVAFQDDRQGAQPGRGDPGGQ